MSTGPHPYSRLPPERFWRTGVAERPPEGIAGLWSPRVEIRGRTRIATFGSCFAQHIGRALVARGYRWMDAEPAPARLPPDRHAAFHYGTFSARTGNIYTPAMLVQWLSWALGDAVPPDEVWQAEGRRVVDPVAPGVEPGGYRSAEELFACRLVTIEALRRAVTEADVFVFTLGLTEAWQNTQTGLEYAACPGTVAGRFDPRRHRFVNHGAADTHAAMTAAIAALRRINPAIRVLLTVSPVPLTATAAGSHVLTATTYSKSVLRAVAGDIVAADPGVDYFPSYEIITAPVFGGRFYAANRRQVTAEGVAFVMDRFFADQARAFRRGVPAPPVAARPVAPPEAADEVEDVDAAEDIRCEEELLDAFAPARG